MSITLDAIQQANDSANRALVTVQRIAELLPIQGADKIELARVRGWQVVVKKGEFRVGDKCAFFEVDSFLPYDDARYSFLMEKGTIVYGGKRGVRLRTIRLRGQLSQGLALPLSQFLIGEPNDGTDITDKCGVVKWDRPIPANLRGKIAGNFPPFIPKTDQERIQNLFHDPVRSPMLPQNLENWYEISLKLDGTSMTVYLDKGGHFGVCSRNFELKEEEGSLYWQAARKLQLEEKLRAAFESSLADGSFQGLAIQGELMGPGIQGNQEKFTDHAFFVFDVYDIGNKTYLPSQFRIKFCEQLQLHHIPLGGVVQLRTDTTLDELLQLAEGDSINQTVLREGVVLKCVQDPSYTFKIINNRWLEENNL
jgi:RNA ligase (TIGR02306 family)